MAERPQWFARPNVGMAHAFMQDRNDVAMCGNATVQPGLEWERAQPERRRCKACLDMLERLAKAERRRA